MSAYFQQILESLKRRRQKPHRLRLRLEPDGTNWRVFDGSRQIALFMPLMLDIWSFSPFEPDELANVEPPGKVVDIHTLRNTAINFGFQGWPPHWLANGGAEHLVKWTWLKKSGAELRARIEVKGPDGESGVWLLGVDYDPARGCYRYTCNVHVRKQDPDPMEGFNLMAPGALADSPEKRRWTHSLWENADGQLRRIVHSNALFDCTDFGGHRDPGGPWRGRNASYPQAWIGYAAHSSFNPTILIHRTSVPLVFATCSQLFDEHIIWSRAGQDNIESDGNFHFRMELELVNLPQPLTGELLRLAGDPVRPKRWRHEQIALPFHVGRVNTFEKAVDPWKPEECPILTLSDPGQWEEGVAHTGRRSIRLEGKGKDVRLELFPTGAVCRVLPYRRYRLSGWIKTRGAKQGAGLELVSFEYTYSNIIEFAASARLAGTRDWTRFAVELDSGEEAYLLPKMVLAGPGIAWFDELLFEEI